jgi:F0F1-type ATP synthase assembly protein I
VSELEESFLMARKLALGIVYGQVGVTLLVSIAGWLLGGAQIGVAALVGGGIGTVSSLYVVLSTFRVDADATPAIILRRVFRGEFYKIAITAGLFSVVLLNMDVAFGPMLGGFAATLVVYWIVLAIRLPDLGTRPEDGLSKG